MLITINPLRWPVFQDVRGPSRDLRMSAAERFQTLVQENARSQHPWDFCWKRSNRCAIWPIIWRKTCRPSSGIVGDFAAFFTEYD